MRGRPGDPAEQAKEVEGAEAGLGGQVAIIRFPSKEAALGLYDDPAYQEAKRIRQKSTSNTSMVLVDQFRA